MKDKKELSKVISALTDAVNALNGFVAEEDEEPVEPEVNELDTFTVEAPAAEEAPVADEVEAEAVEEKSAEEPAEEPEKKVDEELDDEEIEIIDDDENCEECKECDECDNTSKEQPVEEAINDAEVAIKFDDDVEFDECVNKDASLTEAKIADFEDKFGFYVSPRIAEDVFYRDAYILIEPTEAAAAGCEVIYVDADQMIYLYNEGTDNDEYSHYVHSDLDVHSEIKHILQTQLDLAFDEIANVRVVKGKYYR